MTTKDSAVGGSERPPPGGLFAGLEIVMGLIGLAMLASWVPHYRHWPLYADHDVFVTAAHCWDVGLRPYRDYACNNLPGTLYLCWITGKLGGWGNPAAFILADALLVVAWCALVVVWSHRTLGSRLPGWVAALAFLAYYLDLGYAMVAQRDWHASALALGGLLAAQAWPGRWGRRFSAIAAALALTFRPQAVVFLPVLMLQAASLQETWRGRFRVLTVWCLEFAAALGLAYLPIVVQGLLPDLVRSLRLVAPGSAYARWSIGRIGGDLLKPLLVPALVAAPAALLLLRQSARDRGWHGLVRSWLGMTAAALLYKPISPHPHVYLDIPLKVVWTVDCGLVAALLLGLVSQPAITRLALIGLLLGLPITARPRSCDPRASLDAIRPQPDWPVEPPVGYRSSPGLPAASYPWLDYRDTLLWLRDHTRPETRIANVLYAVPSLTGMLGRLPAFPAESIAWVKMVRRDDEPAFAQALEACDDAVVVWAPHEECPDPTYQIPHVEEVIRRKFEFNQRFGSIEIWTARPPS